VEPQGVAASLDPWDATGSAAASGVEAN
jgi:hypothetical protein